MTMPATNYAPSALQRETLDAQPGVVLLQFGTNWCAHCQNAQSIIEPALALRPGLQRYLIEDGPGRALGRSYRIKLWPTLLLLRNGIELGRLVRPQDAHQVEQLLHAAEGAGG